MNIIDVIQLLNSKLFHDLGNSMTILSLLDKNTDLYQSSIDDILFKFQLLRQTFVEPNEELHLSYCYESLMKYFSNTQIQVNDFTKLNHDLLPTQCQLLLNIILSLSTAILYNGEIYIRFNSNICEIQARGKGLIKADICNILNEKDTKLNTQNVQAYFTILLAQKISSRINSSVIDNTITTQIKFS